jgi:hypothetical protein
VYSNRYPGLLDEEMEEAKAVEARAVEAPGAAFNELAAEGERLLYVVTTEAVVVVCQEFVQMSRTTHSVLARGRDVLAAGEVELVQLGTTRMVTELNNHSGHYAPGSDCLDVAVAAFEALGFEVRGEVVSPYTEG